MNMTDVVHRPPGGWYRAPALLTELDPVGRVASVPVVERVVQGFGRLVARIRGGVISSPAG